MKFSALALSAATVMAVGAYAQDNTTTPGNTTAPGNTTTPGNTTAPGNGTAGGNTTVPGNGTAGNGTSAPKPTGSSAAFAIAAGSEGIVAAGVFAGLLAALV